MVSPRAGLSAVAIVGPTAVGKSDVADRLAARLSSEVLSCDAMQIYRGMDIGPMSVRRRCVSSTL